MKLGDRGDWADAWGRVKRSRIRPKETRMPHRAPVRLVGHDRTREEKPTYLPWLFKVRLFDVVTVFPGLRAGLY